jgi:hypothetical protein
MHSSGASRRENADLCLTVIASKAKQSILSLLGKMDCFVASLLAMTVGHKPKAPPGGGTGRGLDVRLAAATGRTIRPGGMVPLLDHLNDAA